jgi:hypothetical protein
MTATSFVVFLCYGFAPQTYFGLLYLAATLGEHLDTLESGSQGLLPRLEH